MQIPDPNHTTASAIMRWYERNAEDGHRPHLGASIIGEPCERKLWLTFRWAKKQAWEGRMLRLFDDGKRAEARFVQELRGIGCEVWETDEAGQQFRVSEHGGHFGGSVDAVLQGVPEAPKTVHVGEFKTSNDKAFKELVKKGVKDAKPMHHAQMQVYMGLLELERALYLVENKNDSSVYTERVEFDAAEFNRLMAKARRIIEATEPPPRIADKSEDMACKWCHFAPLCHGTEAPEINCRTCSHATPVMDGDKGNWTCSLASPYEPILLSAQRQGCSVHLYIPPMLRNIAEPVDGGENYVVYRTAAGGEFTNGRAPFFSSKEIFNAKDKTALVDVTIKSVKDQVPTATLRSADPWADMPSDDLDAVPTKPSRKPAHGMQVMNNPGPPPGWPDRIRD